MSTPANLPPLDSIHTQIKRFVRDYTLIVDAEDVPPASGIPELWVNVLRRQTTTGIAHWPNTWSDFEPRLPNALGFLRLNLRGVAVILRPNLPPGLLYIYTLEGRPRFYIGNPPIATGAVPAALAPMWELLSPSLKAFYSQVHDGWMELSSDGGGPQPLSYLSLLSDDRWDIDLNVLPFDGSKALMIFSNAGGDYLCLDTSDSSRDSDSSGILWWHEEPEKSENNLDFWALMDAWINIFVEDADPAS